MRITSLWEDLLPGWTSILKKACQPWGSGLGKQQQLRVRGDPAGELQGRRAQPSAPHQAERPEPRQPKPAPPQRPCALASGGAGTAEEEADCTVSSPAPPRLPRTARTSRALQSLTAPTGTCPSRRAARGARTAASYVRRPRPAHRGSARREGGRPRAWPAEMGRGGT